MHNVEQLSPLIRRIIAPNPSPYTYKGTCTYIVGDGKGACAVIDPGPDHEGHINAVLEAISDNTLTHIVVTHTHKDHSLAAKALQAATGALIVGCGAHQPARALADGEINYLEASADHAYAPDHILRTLDEINGTSWNLIAIETPGHTMNHVCFALSQEKALFSGDHVMGWSTPMIAPPDGQMKAYMASLQALRDRNDAVYYPGHGEAVRDPQRFVRAMIHHRRQREAAIFARIKAGDHTIAQVVAHVYENLNPSLKGAASLTTLAHLESLIIDGHVTCEGEPMMSSVFCAA